jgi:hypothetical protein
MNPIDPPTSARFRRAAASERQQLEGKRTKLEARRQRAADELQRLELQLLAIDERLEILERLAGPEERPVKKPAPNGNGEGMRLLRGTAIRENAIQVLAERPEGRAPVHYRRWYELVEEAGYAVAGKDPLAVFLTQISRSPAIRRSTEAGTYSIDFKAPDELRRRLASLQAQLRQVTSAKPDKPPELVQIRAEREELLTEIKKVERSLDEALRVLRPVERTKAVSP